jgi:putative hydrolase of the HAD superfamily
MSAGDISTSSDWESVSLVAFDVDGTLYRQRPLRVRMAVNLLFDALLKRDMTTIRVLTEFRRIRERLGNEEVPDFARALLAETAAARSLPEDDVRSIVADWIDRRPLPYLAAYRYPGLVELFGGLRRRGKSIGILSDYAAAAKLEALGLAADHVVSAQDEGIGVLKPNPKGLLALIDAAGAEPARTVLVGDRPDRDGLAARRIGARALIRSSRPIEGWQTFASFEGAPFTPFVTA